MQTNHAQDGLGFKVQGFGFRVNAYMGQGSYKYTPLPCLNPYSRGIADVEVNRCLGGTSNDFLPGVHGGEGVQVLFKGLDGDCFL